MNIALLFPGQGLQHRKMFDLLLPLTEVKAELELLQQRLDIDIERDIINGDDSLLFDVAYSQPLICAANYLLWRVLSDKIASPIAMSGYSLGALTACAAAGGLDFAGLLDISIKRGQICKHYAPKHAGLIAVKHIPLAELSKLCERHHCHIAIINNTDHAICGGLQVNLKALSQTLSAQYAAEVKTLHIPIPSHTPLMQDAVEAFYQALQQAGFSDLNIPVISTISAETVFDAKLAMRLLADQLVKTVHWSRTLKIIKELSCDLFFEIGHDESLSHMAGSLFPQLKAKSTASFHSVSGIADWLAKQ